MQGEDGPSKTDNLASQDDLLNPAKLSSLANNFVLAKTNVPDGQTFFPDG